jgi:hypothetical protein
MSLLSSYGFSGFNGFSSVIGKVAYVPYTAQVEEKTRRLTYRPFQG